MANDAEAHGMKGGYRYSPRSWPLTPYYARTGGRNGVTTNPQHTYTHTRTIVVRSGSSPGWCGRSGSQVLRNQNNTCAGGSMHTAGTNETHCAVNVLLGAGPRTLSGGPSDGERTRKRLTTRREESRSERSARKQQQCSPMNSPRRRGVF